MLKESKRKISFLLAFAMLIATCIVPVNKEPAYAARSKTYIDYTRR